MSKERRARSWEPRAAAAILDYEVYKWDEADAIAKVLRGWWWKPLRNMRNKSQASEVFGLTLFLFYVGKAKMQFFQLTRSCGIETCASRR